MTSIGNIYGLPLGQTHAPHNRFNLFFLDQQEMHLDAFTVSCPADQDILSHYKMQQGAKMSRREELETPTFTNDVPAV